MGSPRLHPSTIEAVRDRADLVDIVSEQVVLKKQGKDFVGLCPFHDDKSPSFSVSPAKQFYYCFSCGAGGNVFKFMMELGQRSFTDVVLELAKRYQVPVTTMEPAQQQELQRKLTLREQLYEIVAVATKFYEHALFQPDGKQALTYLREDRQLRDETIQHFQMGYAPPGWQTLYSYLIDQKRYPVNLVEQAGLIVPRQGGDGHYDRFRDRLMVPIHDAQNRLIGFGGRALAADVQPKYLNSPDTELFDKGKTLYGLDKAKAAIAKQDRAIVVEGYFDVIALHAAGITHAVASLGTALNAGQVKQLLRYTESKQIIFNFDADAAGVKAAERGIGEVSEMAYRGDVQLRILTIPDGKDPDDYLRIHTAEEYIALADSAPLWLNWQINKIVRDRDLKQADQFQQASQAIVGLLSDIANADTRTYYLRHCAEIFSQGDSRIVPLLAENLLAQVRRKRRTPGGQKTKPHDTQVLNRSFLEEAEAALLRIYIHRPEHRQAITEGLDLRDLGFSFSHHRALWRMVTELAHIETEQNPQREAVITPEPPKQSLLETLRNFASESTGPLSLVHHLLYLEEKTKLDVLREPLVIRAAIACLEKTMCEKRYRLLLNLWSDSDFDASPEKHTQYQKQIISEKNRIAQLEKERSVDFADLASIPWVQRS